MVLVRLSDPYFALFLPEELTAKFTDYCRHNLVAESFLRDPLDGLAGLNPGCGFSGWSFITNVCLCRSLTF